MPPAFPRLGEFWAVLALVVNEPLLNLEPWANAKIDPPLLLFDISEELFDRPLVAVPDYLMNFYFKLLSKFCMVLGPIWMKLFWIG